MTTNHTHQSRTFSVGDRVIALPGTLWDEDIERGDPDWQFILLAGHYGHVVEKETCAGCGYVHVQFEGCKDQDRSPSPLWVDGTCWHMDPTEIEHID